MQDYDTTINNIWSKTTSIRKMIDLYGRRIIELNENNTPELSTILLDAENLVSESERKLKEFIRLNSFD